MATQRREASQDALEAGTPNMLSALTYEPTSTVDDPSFAIDAGGPRYRARTGGLHPVHWLVEAHWLGRLRTPHVLRIWRYLVGSGVAFVTSTVAMYICVSWFSLGAITAATIAFVAGAVPNWVLNRSWAWQKRGREGIRRETALYAAISLVSWAVSVAITKAGAIGADDMHSLFVRHLLVTGSYVFSVVLLTGLKYVAYNRFVFLAPPSSRNQVLTTTEQNLQP
ncbi:MAG TPA: GtrA family protein [Acidimicrobiales bacterium]|nr:GtrA family protein [Acidimicrobiales bacterium]